VGARDSDVFVHVEGNDILEGDLVGFVCGDELLVYLDWGGAGWQTEDEWVGGRWVVGVDAVWEMC
jgi:hypothetical protein